MTLIGATLHTSHGEARENLLILQDLARNLLEGPGHVSLQQLRLWRKGAPLAMPELQDLGFGSADPRRGW